MVDIFNGIRYAEIEPYGAAAGRALQLRQMYQQQAAADRSRQAEELAIAERRRGVEGTRKLSELMTAHTKDGKTDYDQVYLGLAGAGHGDRALALEKERRAEAKAELENRKQQLANAKEQHALVANGLMAVKNAAEPMKQAAHTAVRNDLIRRGLIQPGDLPEQYDAVTIDAGIAEGVEAEKQIQAAQRALEIAETSRHNTAVETETNRHNKAGEAFQVGQLAEAGRHNRETETLTGTGQKETARHNQRTENLMVAGQGETARHNRASEATAAAGVGNNGGAKFKDSLVSLQNLKQSIDSYRAELDRSGTRYWPGTEGYSKLQSRFTDLQMRMKDLYQLGAITGPDLELLNNALTDPTTIKGNFVGKDALKAQLDVFDDVLKRGENTLRQVYNQPQFSPNTGGITVDTSKVTKPKAVDLSGVSTEDLFKRLANAK